MNCICERNNFWLGGAELAYRAKLRVSSRHRTGPQSHTFYMKGNEMNLEDIKHEVNDLSVEELHELADHCTTLADAVETDEGHRKA